jgi:hypothetical protein
MLLNLLLLFLPSSYCQDSFSSSNTLSSQDPCHDNHTPSCEYSLLLQQKKDFLSTKYKSLIPPKLTPLEMLEEKTPFSVLFQNYILPKIPFKGRMKSAISLSLTECAQAEKMEIHSITKDYPLKNCYSTEVNKVIPIPKIAYNTYSLRLAPPTPSADSETETQKSSNDLILNLTDHWPTILSLDDTLSRPIETCPLDMHMILWGASDDLTARIFQTEISSSYFSPLYGDPVAHYFQYSKNGFPSTASVSTAFPPYTETIIKSGDYLFVPNNHLVSLEINKQATSTGSSSGSDSASTGNVGGRSSVLKFCYFDASNVNDVRTALKLESFLSKTSSNFLKQLNSPSSFDYTMVRDPPTETMVDQFRVYPRVSLETTTATTTKAKEKGEDSNRRNRGKSDYKGETSSASLTSYISFSLRLTHPHHIIRLARNLQMEFLDHLSDHPRAFCAIFAFHWAKICDT